MTCSGACATIAICKEVPPVILLYILLQPILLLFDLAKLQK